MKFELCGLHCVIEISPFDLGTTSFLLVLVVAVSTSPATLLSTTMALTPTSLESFSAKAGSASLSTSGLLGVTVSSTGIRSDGPSKMGGKVLGLIESIGGLVIIALGKYSAVAETDVASFSGSETSNGSMEVLEIASTFLKSSATGLGVLLPVFVLSSRV